MYAMGTVLEDYTKITVAVNSFIHQMVLLLSSMCWELSWTLAGKIVVKETNSAQAVTEVTV